mmetsp:Transcript_3295/g.5555  ORF Transcript_3295/g.5555 Transcript_3295/m.5555 type:complete len:134 (-) Transcript_3295:104-505(-)
MMRPNTLGEHTEYPFISPCGKEMNFIRPADTPIVFEKLDDDEELVFGATHRQPFKPSELVWVEETGRLYHPVTEHKRLAPCLALLRSHLAVQLSENFVYPEKDKDPLRFCWAGEQYDIKWLESMDVKTDVSSS